MPTERMIDAAANYIAAASRCKETWDLSFDRSRQGSPLTDRDLMEAHSAGLGLLWATHTTDLTSALAILHRLETGSSSLRPGSDGHHDQAKRILEERGADRL